MITNFPQTYKTILCINLLNNDTITFILKKKLNVLLKEGVIYKAIIPGTRCGEVIYYTPKKEYNVIVEGSRTGYNKVYCYTKHIKNGRFYITMMDYWILNGCEWKKQDGAKAIFLGNALLVL